MNIFVLDLDTDKAAAYHCDNHASKMCVEYAQLLWTTANIATGKNHVGGYRTTHENHPCAVWLRESAFNVAWLSSLLVALGREFEKRYGKTHKSVVSGSRAALLCYDSLPDVGLTPFAQAMPEQYRNPLDPVSAYRAYYTGEKRELARWRLGQPSWWLSDF